MAGSYDNEGMSYSDQGILGMRSNYLYQVTSFVLKVSKGYNGKLAEGEKNYELLLSLKLLIMIIIDMLSSIVATFSSCHFRKKKKSNCKLSSLNFFSKSCFKYLMQLTHLILFLSL